MSMLGRFCAAGPERTASLRQLTSGNVHVQDSIYAPGDYQCQFSAAERQMLLHELKPWMKYSVNWLTNILWTAVNYDQAEVEHRLCLVA